MPEARVVLALAAEAEDDFIWGELEDIIQTNMYSAGRLASNSLILARRVRVPADRSCRHAGAKTPMTCGHS
jgi:hypothetical protein